MAAAQLRPRDPGARPSSIATVARDSPSPTARAGQARRDEVVAGDRQPAVADVVEPAPGAALARRGQQLDGLGTFATQKAPQLGVADVQGAVEGSKPPAAATMTSRSLPKNPRWSRRAASSSRGIFVQHAASASSPGAGALGQPGHLEALAQQRAAQARSASSSAQRRERLAQQQPQLVAQAVAGDGLAQRAGRSARAVPGSGANPSRAA